MRKIKIPSNMTPGTVYETNGDGKIEIIEYKWCRDVTVRFLDTGTEQSAMAHNIKLGSVKDKMKPSFLGIGFIGIGPHKTTMGRKQTDTYTAWSGMMRRCYDKRTQSLQPTYKGCSVCNEWHNFQNFAEWMLKQDYKGKALDKDILIDGNKIYSPETCLFVTQAENNEKSQAKTYKIKSPLGKVVSVYNLAKFSRENGLCPSNIAKMLRGDISHHKGWTKP